MNDEGWWFQAVEGFWFMTDERTNGRTDICDCRVAFATESLPILGKLQKWGMLNQNLIISLHSHWTRILWIY